MPVFMLQLNLKQISKAKATFGHDFILKRRFSTLIVDLFHLNCPAAFEKKGDCLF